MSIRHVLTLYIVNPFRRARGADAEADEQVQGQGRAEAAHVRAHHRRLRWGCASFISSVSVFNDVHHLMAHHLMVRRSMVRCRIGTI